MNGNSVVLDTNIAIAVLKGDPAARRRLQVFTDICLPIPVLAELLFGALNSAHVADNHQRVGQLADSCQLLAPTRVTAERYAEIRLELKRKGRPIPINDLWIAAIAVEHDLPLATEDAHFKEIDVLKRLDMTP